MASVDSSVEQVRAVWQQNHVLQALPASQAEQVYFVDCQLWSRIEGPISAELILDEVRALLLQSSAS